MFRFKFNFRYAVTLKLFAAQLSPIRLDELVSSVARERYPIYTKNIKLQS